jgi:PAXNEB protein
MNIKLKEKNSSKDIPILDLSKNLDIESSDFTAKGLLKLIHPKDIKGYKDLINHIYLTLQEALTDSNDKSVKRFVFPSFFTTFCALNQDHPEVIKFFQTLRVFARSTYSSFVFSVNTENLKLRNQLRFIFDYVLSLETLKGLIV